MEEKAKMLLPAITVCPRRSVSKNAAEAMNFTDASQILPPEGYSEWQLFETVRLRLEEVIQNSHYWKDQHSQSKYLTSLKKAFRKSGHSVVNGISLQLFSEITVQRSLLGFCLFVSRVPHSWLFP